MRLLLAALVAVVVAVGYPITGVAQDITSPIPQIEEAESIFEQGLDAFRAGDYGMAYRRFRLATDSHEFNQVTTAALVMAAKSLYRDGRYEQAADLARDFLRRYPTSRYVDEAERIQSFAREQIEERERRRPVLQVGVALPLTGSADVTQAMFSGIRLAVEAHNRASGDVMPVRMIFRDTHGDPTTAREVVADLEREGADFIIGPIFSDEARAAAQEAERREIVMLAPLATDEDVAAGRRYIFQANPPITTRGRVLARHALREDVGNFGIVARLGDNIGERMAEGFEDEVFSRNGEVLFYELLNSNSDWSRLPEVIGSDTLREVGALYIGLAGSGSRSSAEAVMRGLSEEALTPRLFGGDGWHGVADQTAASRFNATYATDFYTDPRSSGVRDFEQRYQEVVGQRPDRPAYTGYDVTTYVLSRKIARPDDSLQDVLHNDTSYQGLGIRIDFGRGNVNEAMYIFGYRNGQAELLR